VGGRAGRGVWPGRVIIQTYTPEHYAVSAAKHNYAAFYQREIGYRREHENPPFNRLAYLLYTHTNAAHCQKEAERIFHKLKSEIDFRGIPNITLIGPFPAFIPKARGRFRWQIIIRGSDPTSLLAEVLLPQGWIVDIDPVSLL
jgi:primosomal protein N' (replication factor Y)